MIPVLVLRNGHAARRSYITCGYLKRTRFFTKMLPESVLRLTWAKPALIAISVPRMG